MKRDTYWDRADAGGGEADAGRWLGVVEIRQASCSVVFVGKAWSWEPAAAKLVWDVVKEIRRETGILKLVHHDSEILRMVLP